MNEARPVVSVTSVPVERDSRTYRHAASLARLGYRSIVVEERASEGLDGHMPFELLAAEPGTDRSASQDGAQGGDRGSATVPERGLSRGASFLKGAAEPFLILLGYLKSNRRTTRVLPSAELYYLHSFWQYPAVRRACRRTGAAYIYDAHDSYWDVEAIPGGPLVKLLLGRAERRCVEGAAGFSTVSEGVAELLERRYGRRPRVIRNCHDSRLDEPVERDLRATLGLGDDDLLLVMPGNAKPGDAIEEAVEALGALPDNCHLAFVGRGYEARVTASAVSERVHLLPPVAPTEITSFIESADAALILYRPDDRNYQSALPNRFFHAVAAGLPLLYPPLSEIRRLAEEHELGLAIDPTDPGSIAAAAGRLAQNRELLGRYRENVAAARPKLSWEHEESAVDELVESAL